MNVWKPADSSTNLPVMVHIHGGGFFGGSGNGDNTLLANTGHEVVVSMNYRLGIFGFLADKASEQLGRLRAGGQQAALRWVQDNVWAFGGDPNKVTIFGESAGGSSVCDQIASPTAKGLFQQAISTSGEYNTLLGTPEQAPRIPEDLEVQDCKSELPTRTQANAAGRVRRSGWMRTGHGGHRGVPARTAGSRDRARGLHARGRLSVQRAGHDRADDQRQHANHDPARGAQEGKGEPGAGDRGHRPGRGSGRDRDLRGPVPVAGRYAVRGPCLAGACEVSVVAL